MISNRYSADLSVKGDQMHIDKTKHAGLNERDIARGALLLAGMDLLITLAFTWIGAETHIQPWNPKILVPAFVAAFGLFKFSGEITFFFAKTFQYLAGERKARYSYVTTMRVFNKLMIRLFSFAEKHHVNLVRTVGVQSSSVFLSFRGASDFVVTKSQFILGIFVNMAYLLAYAATVPFMFFYELWKYSHETVKESYALYRIQNQYLRYNRGYRFRRR